MCRDLKFRYGRGKVKEKKEKKVRIQKSLALLGNLIIAPVGGPRGIHLDGQPFHYTGMRLLTSIETLLCVCASNG
jgi:hypothetical protein